MVHRKEREDVKEMFETMNNVISWIDGAVWGLPLIILILCTGIYLSVSMISSNPASGQSPEIYGEK